MHHVREARTVSARLSVRDVLGGWKVRWAIGRNRYRVEPGVYAVGSPNAESPVFVSANYKLSFDAVRSSLAGVDAWILVLDTKGINVWCAAGKGTFGTRELEQKLFAFRVGELVSHRTVILPQLAATGVSAPEVKRDAGWRVVYGPVRARDIRAWLAAGMKKDAAMRRVEFRFRDRMAVAPVELVQAWPFVPAIVAGAALASLPFGPGWAARFFSLLLPLVAAVIGGTLLVPALLPYLPFRAFSLKGAVLGAILGALSSFVVKASLPAGVALTLVMSSITAWLAMNFTGASTYTCQAGAELEVRRGTVPMVAAVVLGVGLFTAQRFF